MMATPVLAQDNMLTLDDDMLKSAEQWARENLSDDALNALQDLDREKVRQFFAQLQQQFHGEYVVNLAGLRDTAKAVLPILESYEETVPYAVWLKPRLDYLDVADEFRLIIPPLKPIPGQPPKPSPNPVPAKEREIWITKFTNRPWPKQAQAYVPLLKPIFIAQQVPPELVWLAEVESSFDPRARSPDGAVGLFQLMPVTAKRYGLRTWPFDQRLKPEENAQAAAHYLHYLKGRFGDWRLALAAYNAGEGTVEDLLSRHKARSFDAIATGLPAETQMYVPKFEGVLLHREGLKIAELKVPELAKPTR
jgi:membrane-bound lytic murein transglycosylase D